MQLDVAFDWFARQKDRFGPGFGDPGGANVVFPNSARLIIGQSPAEVPCGEELEPQD
jgi:hypothetical protein